MLTVEGKTAGTLKHRAFSSQFITMNTSSDRSEASYLISSCLRDFLLLITRVNWQPENLCKYFRNLQLSIQPQKRPSIERLPFNVFPFSECGKFEACGSTKAVAAEALEPRL